VTDDDLTHFDFLDRGLSLIEQKKQDNFEEIAEFIKKLDRETDAAVVAKFGKEGGMKGKKYGQCFLA